MIKKLLIFLLCLGIGLSVGTFTAFQTITHGLASITYKQGPWKTWHNIGKPSLDPYTHAKLVIHRWLPSSAFETLYFISQEDDTGARLKPKCTYLVKGEELRSHIWSLSVYQSDPERKGNETHNFSINSENILRDRSGNWQVQISPAIGTGNALTPESDQTYTLILRLHSYEHGIGDGNLSPLPKIKKVSC